MNVTSGVDQHRTITNAAVKLVASWRQQKVRNDMVITNGKSTLVTEDMDSDKRGDHSPERVEEEE